MKVWYLVLSILTTFSKIYYLTFFVVEKIVFNLRPIKKKGNNGSFPIFLSMVVIWYKKNIITWLNHNFLDQTFLRSNFLCGIWLWCLSRNQVPVFIKKRKRKEKGLVSHDEGIFFLIIVKYIISNTICYIMLYMLEWMPNEKHRIRTSRTRELRGSTLSTNIHGRIL